VAYNTKNVFTKRNLFLCFSISNDLQNFVQVYASANCGFNGHNRQINYLDALAGVMISNSFNFKSFSLEKLLTPDTTVTGILNGQS